MLDGRKVQHLFRPSLPPCSPCPPWLSFIPSPTQTGFIYMEPFQYPRLQSPSLSAASNFPTLSICDLEQWTGASRRRYPPRTCRASSDLSESPARAAESP